MSNLEKFNNKPALSAEAEVVICLRLGKCVRVHCQCLYFSSALSLFCKHKSACYIFIPHQNLRAEV